MHHTCARASRSTIGWSYFLWSTLYTCSYMYMYIVSSTLQLAHREAAANPSALRCKSQALLPRHTYTYNCTSIPHLPATPTSILQARVRVSTPTSIPHLPATPTSILQARVRVSTPTSIPHLPATPTSILPATPTSILQATPTQG